MNLYSCCWPPTESLNALWFGAPAEFSFQSHPPLLVALCGSAKVPQLLYPLAPAEGCINPYVITLGSAKVPRYTYIHIYIYYI